MNTGYITASAELDLYYEEAGTGALTLLLVPGWTMSTAVFGRQLAYFDEHNICRCVTFDPRAHGRSTKTSGGHTYAQHGRDLHSFITALQIDNVVIAGWSFGTLAVLSYIRQFGAQRLRGLVMLDGPPRARGADNRNDWVTYSNDDHDGAEDFFTNGRLRDPEASNLQFAQWLLEDPDEEAIRWLIGITVQTPDQAAAALNATASTYDLRDELIALNAALPLLYYVRDERREVVSQWAQMYTPRALVQAHGGHMMFWEQAETFNANLCDFLARRCGG